MTHFVRFGQLSVQRNACEGPKFNLQSEKRRLQSAGKRGMDAPIPGRMATACRHPRVRIVSRHDDIEFVECLECGDIFDSEEFRDMEIEDTAETQDVSDES
jgi:hypothetical protein